MTPADPETPAPPLAAELGPVPEPARAVDAQWKVYALINEWVRFADVKAGVLLTADGVIAAAVLALFNQQAKFFADHPVARVFAFLCLIALAVSTLACLACINPWVNVEGSGKSLIYFGDIADYRDPPAYRKKAADLAGEDCALDEVTRQVWVNARVAKVKYACVKFAVYAFMVSILLGMGVGAVALSVQ